MKSFKKNPVISGVVYVNGTMLDDTTVVSGDEYEPFADPDTFPGWTPILVESTYERFLIRKGEVAVAADFPDLDLVQDGWLYECTADVKDDDPTKTNTGQDFLDGDEIVWNASLVQWVLQGPRRTVATVAHAASPYGVKDEDELLIADTSGGTVQFNLQTAVGKKGKRIEFKRFGASAVSIIPSGAQTIDGAAGYPINIDKGYVVLESDGANWYVMTPKAEIDDVNSKIVFATGSHRLYVDVNRTDVYAATGSDERPFKTIQAAYDVAKTMSPTYMNPITLLIAPGEYQENLVLDADYIHLVGTGGQFVTNCPKTGVPLIITNATRASVATFLANGGQADPNAHYSDLVWSGTDGPWTLEIRGLSIGDPSGPDQYNVMVLGTNDGTSFCGNEFNFMEGAIFKKVFARLANYLTFQGGCWVSGKIVTRNVAGVWVNDSQIAGYEGYYDSTEDEPSDTGNYGLCGGKTYCVGSIVLNKEAKAGADDPAGALTLFQVAGNIDLNGTSIFTMEGSNISGNIDSEAGASFDLRNVYVQGNLVIANGPGMARMDSGRYMGTLTDPGGKLVRNLGN